eukprot:TRINITY_DN12370_c0_g1_i1.p1 TRINITY_DN12370_c0_g1~~TRINITY_DN12370_c0_g1_i1.p1  ORF type:complete len:1032 (+),score=178.51 TRINITY_DN12370_c0_g1_i1:333-3428(+)
MKRFFLSASTLASQASMSGGRKSLALQPASPRGRSGGSSSPTSPRGRHGSGSPPKRKQPQNETSNVKVVVRVRPFVPRELDIHEQLKTPEDPYLRSIIEMPTTSPGTVSVLDYTKNWVERERFSFDSAIWSIPSDQQEYDGHISDQNDVFTCVGQPVLENTMKGYNNCIFAYGQTGSGKTHTMMGGDDGEDLGVIPMICKGLFKYIDEKRSSEESTQFDLSYKVEVRFLEIYNEHVKDLLWQQRTPEEIDSFRVENRGQAPNPSNLQVRNHPITGPYVQFLTAVECTNVEDCIDLINIGNTERSVASTKMNERSSRSHAVFKITFTQTTKSRPKNKFDKPAVNEKVSSINLVDLAGSERIKKSQSAGQQLVEAASINLSLTTLKMVIDALVENSKNPKKKMPVPFRDATLTWLLSDSLGGNSKTIMCCNVSPHPDNSEETVNTLRYGSKAREIINVVHVNEDLEAKRIQELELEMSLLQEKLNADPESQAVENEDLRNQMDETMHELRMSRQQAAIHVAEKEEFLDARVKLSFQYAFQMVLAEKKRTYWGDSYDATCKELDASRKELEHQKELNEGQRKSMNDAKDDLTGEMARYQQEIASLKSEVASLRQQLQGEKESRQADIDDHQVIASKKNEAWEEEKQILVGRHDTELRRSEDRYKFYVESAEKLQGKLSKELQETNDMQSELSSTNQALAYQVDSLRSTNEALESRVTELRAELREEMAKAGDEWQARFYDSEKEHRRLIEENDEKWHEQFDQKSEETEEIFKSIQNEHKEEKERLKFSMELDFAQEREKLKGEWDVIEEELKTRLNAKTKLTNEMHQFLKAVEVKEAKYSSLAARVSAVMSDVSLEGSPDFMQLLGMLRKFQTEYTSYSPSKEMLQKLLRSKSGIELDPTPVTEEPISFVPLRATSGKRSNSRPASPTRAGFRPPSPSRAGSRPPSPSRAGSRPTSPSQAASPSWAASHPPSPSKPLISTPTRAGSRPPSPRTASRPRSPSRNGSQMGSPRRSSSLVRGAAAKPVIARSRRVCG